MPKHEILGQIFIVLMHAPVGFINGFCCSAYALYIRYQRQGAFVLIRR